MRLNVAVQMDPIERINIRGDSTFALLLEAQNRAYPLSYYTPDRLALRDGKVSATVRHWWCATSSAITSHSASRGTSIYRRSMSCCCARIRVRPRLYLVDAHARPHPSEDPGRQRSEHVRNAPEKVSSWNFPT